MKPLLIKSNLFLSYSCISLICKTYVTYKKIVKKQLNDQRSKLNSGSFLVLKVIEERNSKSSRRFIMNRNFSTKFNNKKKCYSLKLNARLRRFKIALHNHFRVWKSHKYHSRNSGCTALFMKIIHSLYLKAINKHFWENTLGMRH